METQRLPQPVRDEDGTPSAPGDLELVRGIPLLARPRGAEPRQPSPEPREPSVVARVEGPHRGGRSVRDQDLAWALRVRDALTSKVRENMGSRRMRRRPSSSIGPPSRPVSVSASDATTKARSTSRPRGSGAIGRILGTAFLAELDGRWERFRVCHDPGCSAVFFDRSKNQSGKWCSMSSCGNRAKVRAFRERQAAR